MIFFESGAYPTFQLVSDPDSVPVKIVFNILNINCTLVFLPCKCVRLTRYKLFRGIFFLIEMNLYF